MSAAHAGHTSQLDLLPTDANGSAPLATHVAVNHGDWFDPATWADGEIPGDGALVHIPQGVAVSYEGDSDAALFIVRVDGALGFHAEDGIATRMVVDTLLTAPGSHLTIDAGSEMSGTVDVVFAEGRPAAHATHYTTGTPGDGVLGRSGWDPEQLSLGLIAGGEVEITGQHVQSGLQLAEAPMAGASELIFATDIATSGWAPGQKIAIGGTQFLGRDPDGSLISQDEVREIVAVRVEDGRMIVTLDQPLDHDHSGTTHPKTGEVLTGHVANLSRNVTFSSKAADPDGDGIPQAGHSVGQTLAPDDHYVTERGHIMFMHNDDISVVNAAFHGLGRTDKTRPVDDFQTGGLRNNRLIQDQGEIGVYEPDIDTTLETAAEQITNQRGRYALHIHEARGEHAHGDHDSHASAHAMNHGIIGPCPETGGPICHCADPDSPDDCEERDGFDGAWLEGNAIWGSPGWGIVQHSSDAVLKGNAVFGVSGSAIVAESGDETGRWEGNLTMNTHGLGHGIGEAGRYEDSSDFNEDSGGEGIGYYLKARAIEVTDNVAQSSARSGFFYHNNGVGLRNTDAQALDFEGIGHGLDSIHTEDVPIRHFDGNEVIAAETAIRIATDPMDAVRKFNDAWSHLKNLTAWEIDEAGVSITYASKYIFEDFLILGTHDKKSVLGQHDSNGFFFKASVADITVLNSHVENFGSTVYNWTQVGNRQEYRRGYWDPKGPSGYEHAPEYDGMGSVDGIENPAYNLWNTTMVGVTGANLTTSFMRAPAYDVETTGGTVEAMRGTVRIKEPSDSFTPGVDIQLLGDSRDGALVALWREDLANHPDQAAVLEDHVPLAYQESVYLSQVWTADGTEIKRNDFTENAPGLNADLWSGTVLEFAKEDSFGRQVFVYEDFSPLQPSLTNRAVTTNEKLIFTRDMIDGVLAQDGFFRVGGIEDVRFVIMKMAFTDRLSGEIETKKFLVALDLAWHLPEDAQYNGLLLLTDDLIAAPQYRVFQNGVLVPDRAPIVLSDDVPDTLAASGAFVTGAYATDVVAAGGGDDIVRGFASADYIDGGAGHDRLFGGNGWDRLRGGEGDDYLHGHYQRDFLIGGGGNDIMVGGVGRDDLDGGAGDDFLNAGNGNDDLFGGAGNDTLSGGSGRDTLDGGAGMDSLYGGTGKDHLMGDTGDDVLAGEAGDDLLFGGDGNDALNGGARVDQLFGGNGNDLLSGEAGHDDLFGEDGNDALSGGSGKDLLFGGDGEDTLAGNAGDDTLSGDSGADILLGGSGNDRLTGGNGADKFVFEKDSGTDIITDFEDGIDAIEFLIDAFGFENLEILDDGDDSVVTHGSGTVRLVDVNAAQLDASDFVFTVSHTVPETPLN